MLIRKHTSLFNYWIWIHHRGIRKCFLVSVIAISQVILLVYYFNFMSVSPKLKLNHQEDHVDWMPKERIWPEIVYRYPPLLKDDDNSTIWTISDGESLQTKWMNKLSKVRPTVTLAVVACGSRLEEAINMLKSAIIFSQYANLHIVGVADAMTQPLFANQVNKLRLQAAYLEISLTYEIYPTWFPQEDHELWRSMFLPCSAQRLFFPSMFPHIDSVMYIDADSLFLSDVLTFWNHFGRMKRNFKQLAAMAPEDEELANGWYNINSKIPYFKPRGLNAGIMLMNLTRMRAFKLEERSKTILKTYPDTIKWADQDILNILFNFHPEYLYQLSCSYNVRAQHCNCVYFPPGDCSCHAVKETGASILHGNRKLFHEFEHARTEFFRDFYSTFQQLDVVFNKSRPIKFHLKLFYDNLKTIYDQNEPCQGASSQDMLQKFEFYLFKLKLKTTSHIK